MKKKFALFLFILAPALLFGQSNFTKDFEITESKPYPVIDSDDKRYFSDGESSVIMAKMDGDVLIIQRLDVSGMKETSRKEYEDFPDEAGFESWINLKGKLYYIFSIRDKKRKTMAIFSRRLDFKTGLFDEPRELFSSNGSFSMQGSVRTGGFDFTVIYTDFNVSEDESKIVITYNKKEDEVSKTPALKGYCVLDSELNILWNAEVEMPDTFGTSEELSRIITNKGNIHYLKFTKETSTFELINVTSENVSSRSVDLSDPIAFQRIRMTEDREGNLIWGGFYVKVKVTGRPLLGAEIKTVKPDGVFFFKMGDDGNILKSNLFDFPLELINQNVSEKEVVRNEKLEQEDFAGIDNLQMKEIHVNDDASITIVGEQYIQYVTTSSNGTSTSHHYGDMLVVKVDPSGKLDWMKKLPKKFYSANSNADRSYKYIHGAENDCVLFMDHRENLSLDADEAPKVCRDGGDGLLTMYKINKGSGEVSKHTLVDFRNVNGKEVFQFRMDRLIDLSEKSFLTEVYTKGKQDMMLKLDRID